MIIQLRRRHYYTWLSIAVLLPMGFIWAYLNIPETSSDNFSKMAVAAYPNLIKSQETTALKANLRKNTEGGYQIELTVLQPLVGAANQLYVSTTPDKPLQTVLGAVSNRGTYYFSLPNSVTSESTLTLTVYDVIKQKQTEQTIFK
jgi:hypothetical protein